MLESKVAIVVPEKNNVHLTVRLLNSILYHSSYDREHMKIYIADTGSDDKTKEVIKLFLKRAQELDGIQWKFIEYDYYNFAKINNDVVKNHVDDDTDVIILCNNDVELIDDAISDVVAAIERTPDIGTVGIRLMYDMNALQHAGMLLSFVHYKGHHTFFSTHFLLKKTVPINKKYGEIESCGNTGAFFATPYALWKKYGGLSEEYTNCYEDVHYNLTCLLDGKKHLTLLDTRAWHYESATRKGEILKPDVRRINAFAEKHIKELKPIMKRIIKTAWQVFSEKGLTNDSAEEEKGYAKIQLVFEFDEEERKKPVPQEIGTKEEGASKIRYIEIGGRLRQGLSGETGG